MAETETLRIPIGLDTKDVQSDAQSLKKKIEDAFDSSAMEEQNKELQKVAQSMKQTYNQASELQDKLEDLRNVRVYNPEYLEIEDQINRDTAALQKLSNKMWEFKEWGGDTKSDAFLKMEVQADELRNSIEYAQGELQDLVDTGKAFTLGDKEGIAKVEAQLDVVNDKMKIQLGNYDEAVAKAEAQAAAEKEVADNADNAAKKMKDSPSLMKRAADRAKELSHNMREVASHANNSNFSFKKLAGTMLGVALGARGIVAIIRKLGSYAREGFANLTKESTRAANSMNLLNAKFLQLKNAVGAAVAPLVSMIVPVITRIIDLFTRAFNAVARFFSLFTGAKTVSVAKTLNETAAAAGGGGGGGGGKKGKTAEEKYQEAVDKAQLKYEKDLAKYNDKVAKAEKKQADAAAKLAKEQEKANGQLASFDELNNLTQDSIDDTIDDMEDFSDEMPTLEMPEMPEMDDLGGGGAGLVDMFEDIPVDDKLPEWLQGIIDKLKELKDIFLQGFFDGLGDWKTRLEDILKNLGIIKNALIDIWTDPAVVNAADEWLKSLVYMLGSLAGSIASIGLTIAQNLVGGIAKYLDQNRDRIKQHLITMFDVWTEINETLATFFQDFAYIFEAFGGENGQQVTANLIGIFADAFMGIEELLSKWVRDVLDAFLSPIHEHRDDIRQIVDDILGYVASVTGIIKEYVDTVVDTMNKLYDEHLAPVFENLKSILNDLWDDFIAIWNENVKPILDDIVAGFQEIWEAAQPVITEIGEAVGAAVDAIMAVLMPLWNNVLQPLIQWIQTYILPVVTTALQSVWNIVKNVIVNIMNIIRPIVSFIKDVFKLIGDFISGDWDAAWQDFMNIIQDAWDVVKGILDLLYDFVIDVFGGIWDTFQSAFENFNEGILRLIERIAEFIANAKNKIAEFIAWFIGKKDQMKQDIINFIENVKNDFMAKVDEWLGKLRNFRDKVVNGLLSMINHVIDWKNRVSDLIGRAVDFVVGLFQKLADWIDNIGQKFSDFKESVSNFSISGMISNAGSWVSNKVHGYASGQVIPPNMAAHLAVLGDNNSETEVVSPLSTMKEAMIEALESVNLSGGSNAPIIVQIDGREVFRAVRDQNNIYQNQTGISAFA